MKNKSHCNCKKSRKTYYISPRTNNIDISVVCIVIDSCITRQTSNKNKQWLTYYCIHSTQFNLYICRYFAFIHSCSGKKNSTHFTTRDILKKLINSEVILNHYVPMCKSYSKWRSNKKTKQMYFRNHIHLLILLHFQRKRKPCFLFKNRLFIIIRV